MLLIFSVSLQTPVDSSNIEWISADVQNLTSLPLTLTYPDVIHTAQVLDNLAGSELPSLQVSAILSDDLLISCAYYYVHIHLALEYLWSLDPSAGG